METKSLAFGVSLFVSVLWTVCWLKIILNLPTDVPVFILYILIGAVISYKSEYERFDKFTALMIVILITGWSYIFTITTFFDLVRREKCMKGKKSLRKNKSRT